MSETTPAIQVQGLRRTYGQGADAFEAVRGIDLQVRRGTVHALLGVNGAGKTSTLEVLEGLAPATAGEVRVLGLDPVADRAEVRRRTGVLLQRSGFVADLTVRETLTMWAATVTEARGVEESLEMLDLTRVAGTRMRGLSGGEQRRVDLACALTGRPELVVLDEPTTGLDPESRRAVWQLVRDLRDSGATVLLTTHYLEEADALAERIVVIDRGRVIADDTASRLKGGLGDRVVLGFADDEAAGRAASRVARTGQDATIEQAGAVVSLRARAAHTEVAALLVDLDRQGLGVRSVEVTRPTLDDVFLQITGRSLREANDETAGAQPGTGNDEDEVAA